MAKKMLIVHGYSDGSTNFEEIGDFFVQHAGYRKQDLFYVDYSSMDDEATFRDFGDKLDEDYEARFGGERIDVACHSTGSLVVRAWLALRYLRRKQREQDLTCPVHRLLMFAPANFGSDLATMGQSFLGKFRTTFFNKHAHKKEDFFESGKRVLQGLEPASPFQWELSSIDLGSPDSFFARAGSADQPSDQPSDQHCFPFVFAAADAYGGLQAKLIKKRKMLGTDGTVRISGTSLNVKRCRLSFREHDCVFTWGKEHGHPEIPFAMFAGFNHGTIVHPQRDEVRELYNREHGPGTLALAALQVENEDQYRAAAQRFQEADEANFEQLEGERKARFQQFFFRVRDDVDLVVHDYFIDFFVLDQAGTPHRDLTERFAEDFETKIYTHSADASHRAVLMNLGAIGDFLRDLKREKARLVFDIAAKPPLPNVSYQRGAFTVYDGAQTDQNQNFIRPNTTTMVDVVLNRRAASKLLSVRSGDPGAAQPSALEALEAAAGPATTETTGRAQLIQESLAEK